MKQRAKYTVQASKQDKQISPNFIFLSYLLGMAAHSTQLNKSKGEKVTTELEKKVEDAVLYFFYHSLLFFYCGVTNQNKELCKHPIQEVSLKKVLKIVL